MTVSTSGVQVGQAPALAPMVVSNLNVLKGPEVSLGNVTDDFITYVGELKTKAQDRCSG